MQRNTNRAPADSSDPTIAELVSPLYDGMLTPLERLAACWDIVKGAEMTPEAFKERRVVLGYTQGTLARTLKVHPQSVGNWERFGPVPPDIAARMHKLAPESPLTAALAQLAPGETYLVKDWVHTRDRLTDEANTAALYKKFKVPSLRGKTFDFHIMVSGDPSQGFGITRRL